MARRIYRQSDQYDQSVFALTRVFTTELNNYFLTLSMYKELMSLSLVFWHYHLTITNVLKVCWSIAIIRRRKNAHIFCYLHQNTNQINNDRTARNSPFNWVFMGTLTWHDHFQCSSCLSIIQGWQCLQWQSQLCFYTLNKQVWLS